MGSKKRTSKAARKQSGSSKIPTWFYDKDAPISVKREVEDALARHAADNGLGVGSAKFSSLSLQDICASLKPLHARWSKVEPAMINTATQPAMQALAAHLRECKRKRKMMAQMVADVKAADADEQSGQSGAEEGEEEEVQMDDSDGEQADQQPAYAKGDPRDELVQEAGGDEGTARDDEEKAPLIEKILGTIRAAGQARDDAKDAAEHKSGAPGGDQAAQLRITAEDVVRWAELGEHCKRAQYHHQEIERAEKEIGRLVAGTPLRYSYRAVRNLMTLRADASEAGSEQQGEQPTAAEANE